MHRQTACSGLASSKDSLLQALKHHLNLQQTLHPIAQHCCHMDAMHMDAMH